MVPTELIIDVVGDAEEISAVAKIDDVGEKSEFCWWTWKIHLSSECATKANR